MRKSNKLPRLLARTFMAGLFCILSLSSFAAMANEKVESKTSNLKTEKINIQRKVPPYEINCQFPVFIKDESQADSEELEELNKKTKKLVEERVTESKNNFKDREYQKWQNSYLEIGYEVFEPNKQVICIVFALESFAAGAAHPIHWKESLVYDRKSKSFLKLSTVLNNSPRPLERVAEICIKDLTGKKGLSDAEWIKEGAGPKAKNYKTFYLDKDGIGIIFNEYQVGPYVSGAYYCKIPYSQLKSFLNPALNLSN